MHYIIPAALSAFVLTGCGGGTSISENKLNDQPSNSSDGITPELIYPNSMDEYVSEEFSAKIMLKTSNY